MYFSDVGVKKRKLDPNDISVHQVAAQRMLGTALEREGKSGRTILQTIEKRIRSTRFKGKWDYSHLSGMEEKTRVQRTFVENHKKVWDQAKVFSGYNTVRKDPDSLMGLSSLFLKKPGLSRKDIKKILLLQDNRGDLRSWVKVVKPEVSGNCRKGCGKIESASHMLEGCPKLPFSLQKSRHDGGNNPNRE